jgi:hypothetical protein
VVGAGEPAGPGDGSVRDDEGIAERDHESTGEERAAANEVRDDEALWRRLIHPDWIAPDGTRPSSMAFKDRRSGEVSVHRAELTTEAIVVARFPSHGIAECLARVPRDLGLAVLPDPEPDDVSHALIASTPVGDVMKQARKLARASRIVRAVPDR